MPYGWMGTDLEVDLSSGKVEKQQGDPKLVETYLGGKGTSFKTLWDRIPPDVDPLSPDNLLIIGVGILTGTIVPSANRAVIAFQSPVTDTPSFCALGGHWGAEIKQAGYDNIVISGKSPTPVYLWINDDKVELRDASHLWGKSISETRRMIREELKVDKAEIAGIGPAGENKVYVASIEHSAGTSASRAGIGAVMGSKNLKAIAVRGTKDVDIANAPRLIELCEGILSRTDEIRKHQLGNYEEMWRFLLSGSCWGNIGEGMPDELKQGVRGSLQTIKDFIDTSRAREMGGYNCGIRCKHRYPLPDGRSVTFKCIPFAGFMTNAKMIDCDFAVACLDLTQEMGMDAISTGNTVALAIDLYEKGILTKKDTDGMHLEWGNKEVFLSLIGKIARREGIGDVLANGVYRAAHQIGKGAEECICTVKKLDQIPFVMFGPYPALALAISDRADSTRVETNPPQLMRLYPLEDREAYIKSGFFHYPKELEPYLLEEVDWSGANYEGWVQFAAYDEEGYTLSNLTGICMYWMGFLHYPPINSRALIADLISSTTGMDIDEAETTKIIKRVINLVKASNLRAGLRRKDDTVPEIWFKRSPRPPWVTLDHGRFDKWVDRFYEIRGWNKDGIPTKETLEELGLDYVSQDLEQRGILTG